MQTHSGDDQRVRALIGSAREHARRGKAQEALRLLRQAEMESPRHPLVLNELALQLLHSGNARGAAELLELACSAASANPEIHFNRAKALRALGRLDEAIAAFDRALEIDPRRIAALLEKGAAEEAKNEPRAAAMSFRTALQMIPPGVSPPEELVSLVEHAREAVEANNRALETHVEQSLRDLRARFPDESLHRFEQCLDIMLQKRRIYRQQPTFMYYPELPAIEFYDRKLFAWLETVERATEDIQEELLNVLSEGTGLAPYVAMGDRAASGTQWRELNHSRRWSVYSLWNEGKAFPDHMARCPKTMAALETVPLWDIPDYGPTALFSILDAKTRIPAHTGPVNTRLIVHLPLIVPPGCGFRVGGQTRTWNPGEAFVFDDSIDHEAWNDSDVPRAVLIFSIWKPFLSEAERALTRALTTSIGAFYGTRASGAAI